MPTAPSRSGGGWCAAYFGSVADRILVRRTDAGLANRVSGNVEFLFRPRVGGYRSRYNTIATQGESQVKIKKTAGAVAATAAMFGLGAVPPAWAISNIQVMGVAETLKDVNGPLIGYTVTGLMPSSDPVPYPVAGLYEATVKADALVGTVMPAVWDFNARAESGANYRALANVSSLSAAPIGQGGSSTGKVYFDVVGDMPNSVVFNNGFEDILGWIQPPGISPGGSPTGGGGGGGASTGANGGATGGGGNAQLGPFGPGGNTGGDSGNGVTGNDPGAGGGATGSGGSGAAGDTGSGAAGGGAG